VSRQVLERIEPRADRADVDVTIERADGLAQGEVARRPGARAAEMAGEEPVPIRNSPMTSGQTGATMSKASVKQVQGIESVALLARQSSSRDERDPATQFVYTEEIANRHGWRVATKHVEKNTSGGRLLEKRPGLLAALEDVRAKRATRVLVAHRDRLDRNLDVRRAYVAAVEVAGGEVWTPDGRMTFSNPTDKLVQTQLGALDENYRDVIRDKVMRQKTERMEKGYPVTALPKIGYWNPGGDSPALVIEEDRVHVVRMFELAADGKSSDEIVTYLRSEGYEATHSMVNKWLRNETFVGNLVWGELRHDGAHEAIIAPRLWKRVQEVRTERKPVGRKAKSDLLLSRLGVVRCSCGAAMIGNTKVYVCSNREKHEDKASISSNRLEDIVLDKLAREIRGMRGQSGDVLGPALAEQERANEALAKLRKIARLADDVEGMAGEIAEAKDRVARADAAVDDARSVAGVSWTVSSVLSTDGIESPCFDGVSRETLRDLVATVFETVTVAKRGDGLSFEDRVSFKLHETFDVQPTLDTAATDLAEVLAIPTAVDVDLPTPLLQEAAAS
jgi:DNA invertase Pin-like site-specific DNA recombinase